MVHKLMFVLSCLAVLSLTFFCKIFMWTCKKTGHADASHRNKDIKKQLNVLKCATVFNVSDKIKKEVFLFCIRMNISVVILVKEIYQSLCLKHYT